MPDTDAAVTLDELREAKWTLESEVRRLLVAFADRTGVDVTDLRVQTEQLNSGRHRILRVRAGVALGEL